MTGVYLLRHFSIEQLEHLAKMRSPKTACRLQPELRRYLGIGNSTGLGMAPFLINHPQLIAQWVIQRETALALALQQAPTEDDRVKLIELLNRASQHLKETHSENDDQRERNVETRTALPNIVNWLENTPLVPTLWAELVEWSKNAMSLEAQELINTLIMELYPHLIDHLELSMGVDENLDLEPDMSLIRLRQLIETHYQWALSEDYSQENSSYWFWYRSEEKEEPRMGVRHQEPGVEKEMQIAIAPRVSRTYDAICQHLENDAKASVVDFLLANPRHKDIIRRIQTLVKMPYGEIHANLWHKNIKPMHLLRAKLAFFGASRFDPRSDRWVRITLFQGAPLVEELNQSPKSMDLFDDWTFPVQPQPRVSDANGGSSE